MKKEANHKKDYRKKIEAQLNNIIESHLATFNKEVSLKVSKTVQDAVKQIAKKFYKVHVDIETEKNEKVISEIVKAKSLKKISEKVIPQSIGKIKFDKIFENKPKEKVVIKKSKPVKKSIVPKVSVKKVIIKKNVAKPNVVKEKSAKPIAILKNIPKEFKVTISKKTSKK